MGLGLSHRSYSRYTKHCEQVAALINSRLYEVVRQISKEIIETFVVDGKDLNSYEFLSSFPYVFTWFDKSDRHQRVLDAALAPEYKTEVERAIEAGYSDSAGGTFERHVCDAVDDFLNYIIPRSAGLPDADEIFDRYYAQFDASMFDKECVVTTFAVLRNVWDNGLRAVLPPGYCLRYFSKTHGLKPDNGWARERLIPYCEILKQAHPIGLGRPIVADGAYFVFLHSTTLPKNRHLISAAYTLQGEVTRQFIFAVRLLKHSAAFSDYRGFRTIGHLGPYSMNLMNYPEDYIEGGVSLELQEHDGARLRRILPRLSKEKYGYIAVLDTKMEDALRRERRGTERDPEAALRVAIDQLLDYFQILEAIVTVTGSEFIALYAAVLMSATNKTERKAAWDNYQFVKRMHKVRNDVMHGRINDVLTSNKSKFSPSDIARFRVIVHTLSTAYIMNGQLREPATHLALGESVTLSSAYPESVGELNEMRKPQKHPPTWW